MINIEEMKKRCCESDPSLAVYMVRDTPEVKEAGLLDLAWALCNGCHKNDALGFFELLEAHLTKRAPALGWVCGKCKSSNKDGVSLCCFCDAPRLSG